MLRYIYIVNNIEIESITMFSIVLRYNSHSSKIEKLQDDFENKIFNYDLIYFSKIFKIYLKT
jgi:hypothetical protein